MIRLPIILNILPGITIIFPPGSIIYGVFKMHSVVPNKTALAKLCELPSPLPPDDMDVVAKDNAGTELTAFPIRPPPAYCAVNELQNNPDKMMHKKTIFMQELIFKLSFKGPPCKPVGQNL